LGLSMALVRRPQAIGGRPTGLLGGEAVTEPTLTAR
jgi:hypothetical protein